MNKVRRREKNNIETRWCNKKKTIPGQCGDTGDPSHPF